MTARTYTLPIKDKTIAAQHLDKLTPDDLRDTVRYWFFQHFEYPDERPPYKSSEGGYIWIWGGPFNARNEVYSEFLDMVSQHLLDPIIDELESESTEWGPAESLEDYDDSYIGDISNIKDHFQLLKDAVNSNALLGGLSIPPDLIQNHYQLLYANMIAILEAYLSGTFISMVLSSPFNKEKLVETSPDFKDEKFTVSDIYKIHKKMDNKIIKYLSEVMWHNLDKISKMFKATLAIEFPSDISILHKAVSLRHDIVHRNGHTKDGNKINISTENLSILRDNVLFMSSHIEKQINPLDSI